jgi:hypothetical protein
MSSRAIRTGLARPGVTRLRTKVTFPTVARQSAEALCVEPRELWVALHLPWLAIEALGLAARNEPRAVVELQGQTQYIVAVCERAQRFGVRAGMSMAAALALVPGLVTLARDLTREQRLLERLATRAQRFTPRVSLVPPDGLVLEVKGSLHLFGGAAGLCQAVEVDCYEAGVKPLLALAPAPLAALAGARAGKPLLITEPAHLVGQIASLPLLTLRWPVEVIDRLKQIGVYTIGEALRLPRRASRAGSARRSCSSSTGSPGGMPTFAAASMRASGFVASASCSTSWSITRPFSPRSRRCSKSWVRFSRRASAASRGSIAC